MVPQPPSVPVSLKAREAIDVQAMQVQAQAMQALQTKPMPKAGVGNAAKAKPEVAKVQQKKMPRKPQAPPETRKGDPCEEDALEAGRKLGYCQRGVCCNGGGATTGRAKGQRQRVDAAAKPLAPADRTTWFRGGGVGGKQPVGQNVGGSGVIGLFFLVSQHFQLQSSK